MAQGARGLSQSSRSFLVSKALRIAQKKHAELIQGTMEQTRILPCVDFHELSDVIKFVTSFHTESTPPSTLKTLAFLISSSLCNVLPKLGTKANEVLSKVRNSTLPNKHTEVLHRSGLTVSDLIELANMSKQSGDKLSKETYGELLKLCLSLINSSKTQTTETPAVMAMVDHMIQDWGKEEVQLTTYSSAIQASTTSSQVDRFYKHIKGTSIQQKLDKELLVEAYLKTEGVPRPSLSRLVSQDPDHLPSGQTLSRLILSCADRHQLRRCIGLYTCMTRRYRIAPSRMVFSFVTKLLTQSFTAKPVTIQFRLGLCSQLLTDTLYAFDGEPPIWVYPEMAKPLTVLLGTSGYEQMMEGSGVMAQKYCETHKDANITDVLRDVWDASVFKSLLNIAHKTRDLPLAMSLFSDLKLLHLPGSQSQPQRVFGVKWDQVFEKLLNTIHSRNDVFDHLPNIIEETMGLLNKKQISALREPLYRALQRAYHQNHLRRRDHFREGTLSSSPVPSYLLSASQLLIDTALQSTDQCISDLSQCAGKHCDNTIQCEEQDSALVAA